MQAAELHKEIYNPTTLPKSHTTKPYFDMSGFTLGNDDFVSPPAAAAPVQNAWKPINPPTHQALIMGNRQPRQNDDRSLTSNTDNASLANTLATFETNLTSAITTIFEQQNHQRTIERKDAADAEARREEQRKADVITREQQHRDEVQRMEKLELRRDKERAADRAADQLQSQQMMIQMMQQLFHGGSVPVGPLAATHQDVLVESIYGVINTDNQAATGPTATNEQELVDSMQQAQLTSGGTTKRHKSDTTMDTTANPTRTEDMRDVQHQASVGNDPPNRGSTLRAPHSPVKIPVAHQR